jgi:hypothetical protein
MFRTYSYINIYTGTNIDKEEDCIAGFVTIPSARSTEVKFVA